MEDRCITYSRRNYALENCRNCEVGLPPNPYSRILGLFFKRENIISERGVEIRNMLFGRTIMADLWKWSEVSSIEANYEKKAPDVQLLISKDIVIRDFIMTRHDAEKALDLAYRMNSAIRNNDQ